MTLTARERERFERDGFVVRESVLAEPELAELRDAVEDVATRLVERATRDGAGPEKQLPDGHRIQFSSHTAIQWEWRDGSREIRLCEPCDHLDPRFERLFADERLTTIAADAIGRAPGDIAPFTSKLNLKRAFEGSEFPWHQDYPYWYVSVGTDAADVVTEIVFLDDATAENGAVHVVAGSHARGPAPRDPDDPTRSLADPARLDLDREVVVEAPAGSVLLFGAYLVHRSSPNLSGHHRRALLPSYQPAGRPRLQEVPHVRERVEELP
jgi:ectoine hydroxylase